MSRDRPATDRTLRSFGLVLCAAFALWALLAHRRGYAPPFVLALGAVGALLGVLGLAAPSLLRLPYRAWMGLGNAMGRVTTPVLLALVFALVFVPLRVLLRALGKDSLGLRFDRGAKSYWVERGRRAFGRDDFERLS